MLPIIRQVSKKTSLGNFYVLVEKKKSLSAASELQVELRSEIISSAKQPFWRHTYGLKRKLSSSQLCKIWKGVLFQLLPINTVNIFCDFGFRIPLTLIYVPFSIGNASYIVTQKAGKTWYRRFKINIRQIESPTHCKTSTTFHNIRTYSHVTMVYRRNESKGRAQKKKTLFSVLWGDISKPRPQNRNREQPIPGSVPVEPLQL